MPRTVQDLELERLRFELALQGYTSREIAKLREYLCDIRHVLLGRATMTISPQSLPCNRAPSEWLPLSVLSYQDITLLATYAKNPEAVEAADDTDFFKAIFSTNEAVEILEAMVDLHSIKIGIMPQGVEAAHEEKYLKEARAFLNFFRGSIPGVTYYEY